VESEKLSCRGRAADSWHVSPPTRHIFCLYSALRCLLVSVWEKISCARSGLLTHVTDLTVPKRSSGRCRGWTSAEWGSSGRSPRSRLLARASIRDVDDGHPNGINLRKRKSVLDICSSHPYLWCDSAKRRMKWLLASHPRGLLLADFPNNF